MGMFTSCIHLLLVVLCIGIIHGIDIDTWPPDRSDPCTQTTKLKAMYGKMTFNTSFSVSPMIELSVEVELDAMEFTPHNPRSNAGFYIAYTTGIKGGQGGYFGVQLKKKHGGQFMFSIWDKDHWNGTGENRVPKPSNKLTWPLNIARCKRNCQDCGKKNKDKWYKGITTGTQCKLQYPNMKVGDKYLVTLKRVKIQETINTKDYKGMPKSHAKFGEVDRNITGGIWTVNVKDIKRGNTMEIGRIMFEGDGRGMNRLGTFDEMLGCNKCNSIYHKDTRRGLQVINEKGEILQPIKMQGRIKLDASTCKKYMITGSSKDRSITFESGPLTKKSMPPKKVIWEV